jgi:aquaporin Z
MIKKGLAECLGTFLLVFCGTGACVINEVTNGAISHVGIAITFGLVVTSLIYAFGNISGANMNPAVSIALWLGQKMDSMTMIIYVSMQVIGALFASMLLHYLFPVSEFLGATLPSGSHLQAFIMEFILTFILMFVIVRVAIHDVKYHNIAGIIIGFVVLFEAMFAGPICGASMNPARSIGPALVSGHVDGLWIYLSAPVLGAIVAYYIAEYFFVKE